MDGALVRAEDAAAAGTDKGTERDEIAELPHGVVEPDDSRWEHDMCSGVLRSL